MKPNHKIVKISTMLIKYFIVYSLMSVFAYIVAYSVFNFLFVDFTLSDTQSYFAKSADNNRYPDIDKEKIMDAGGSVVELDEAGTVVGGTSLEGVGQFDLHDIADLANGKYEYRGNLYFASVANFEQNGEDRTVAAILPAEHAEATYYIQNIPGTEEKSFIVVLLIAVSIFVLLYILITVMIAGHLNSHIVSPILAITQALEALKSEEYNISLDFKAKNEFVFIKNAFDLMLVRLSEAEQQRKERQQEKLKLLSAIGHDIRTPVTVIGGLLQALMSGKILDEKIRSKYIETIYRNTKVLSDLIELQLDYTLWERKDDKLLMERQNLSECIRDVIITNYALCDEEGIELDIHIPDVDIFCEMDLGQMRRAFSNLLTNAIFHNTEISCLKIGIYVQENKGSIEIHIADTGKPLPDDVIKSLQSTIALRERPNRGAGHGLGLSITQRIIELHGGSIYPQNNWRHYTKAFVIILPNT